MDTEFKIVEPSGGILTESSIREAVQKREIVIEPYDPACVNSNSYDIHIGDTIKVYGHWKEQNWFERLILKPLLKLIGKHHFTDDIVLPSLIEPLDVKNRNFETVEVEIPEEGLILKPGIGYLGSTQEYTENHKYIPVIYGKSSLGRLFLLVHYTAGFGDVGFKNHWTLELSCVHPLRIYPNQKIGQLVFFNPQGEVEENYSQRETSKYKEVSDKPKESQFGKNFDENGDRI